MTKKPETEELMRALIDRIEDDIAVLILSDESLLNVPRKQLPVEAKEGDLLQVTFDAKTGNAIHFRLDDQATNAAQNRVAELQSELSADDDATPMNIQL